MCLIKVTFSVTLNSYLLCNCKGSSALLMKSEIETQLNMELHTNVFSLTAVFLVALCTYCMLVEMR